jgi:hypothetical protein
MHLTNNPSGDLPHRYTKKEREAEMISLQAIYGDKLLNQKRAYKFSSYIGFFGNIVISIIAAYAVIKFFDLRMEHAFWKVIFILGIFELTKTLLAYLFNKFNYHMTMKDTIEGEVRHYLRVFGLPFDDENSGCVEDYLIEAAFDHRLDRNMNVLAAINYAQVVGIMSIDPKWDRYYYDAWLKIAPDYIPTKN